MIAVLGGFGAAACWATTSDRTRSPFASVSSLLSSGALPLTPFATLFPQALLPLYIFEPRYLALLEDCLKTRSRLIGMIDKNIDGKIKVRVAADAASSATTVPPCISATCSTIARPSPEPGMLRAEVAR